ncbi:MAG: DUF1549 domain-containing protein [Planctomycetaceae bacterium]
MSTSRDRQSELLKLLDALCEERLTHEQAARLERLVLRDRAARRLYLDYLHLHGTLLWDAARADGFASDDGVPDRERSVEERPAARAKTSVAPARHPAAQGNDRRAARAWILTAAGTAALVVAGYFGWWVRPVQPPAGPGVAGPVLPPQHDPSYDVPRNPTHYRPIRLERVVVDDDPEPPVVAIKPEVPIAVPTDIVAFVDERIAQGWTDAGVTPSPAADDAEWLRRVSLDLTGHIPTASDVEAFLADTATDKRDRYVERLLAGPDFDRHLATVWTNLLVGRADPAVGDRDALLAFLRQAFAQNRPWDETVAAFVAAEGPIDTTPAANFLVAHLNNEAVPATAITAKVFLGTQVQCMQCHHHPFNDWTQEDFWELNSFFQQTELVRNEQGVPTLVSKDVGGPTMYETLGGLMKAAYPKYEGHEISEEPLVDRRAELAKLLAEGDRPQLAVAFVNRLWARLLGAGFVNPVDDMGPHNVASHPEALDRLARAFVASDYDVKQLVKWITSTRAYRLSNRVNETNGDDDPTTGQVPLFSRAYPKPMTVEQVYDSLVVATHSDLPSSESLAERDAWVRQFVRTYQTDENDESVAFTSTVPVALALMNGEAVRESLEPAPGTTLQKVLAAPGDETVKLRKLALATLGRPLAPKESATLRRMVRQAVASAPPADRQVAVVAAYQDVLWALLNSGEFVTVP